MKRFLFAIAAMVVLLSCQSKEEKAAKALELRKKTFLALANQWKDLKQSDLFEDYVDSLKLNFPDSEEFIVANTMLSEYKDSLSIVKKQKEARLDSCRKQAEIATSKLRKNYDDVEGITWYHPKFNHSIYSTLTSMYIGYKDNSVWIRMQMSYSGDTWIFFEKAYLSYDENTHEIIFDRYKNKNTEVGAGKVAEWIDVSINKTTLDYIRQMVDGNVLKMRLSGKYVETKNLSKSEIKGLKDVLDAYDALTNLINQ